MDVALQIYSIRRRLKQLPSYGISPKTIRGKTYYYRQTTENGRRKQVLIHKDEDLAKILSVYRLRQRLKQCLRLLLSQLNREIRLRLRFYEKYGRLWEERPPDERHLNRTAMGKYRISKSELILSQLFEMLGIRADYEEKTLLGYLPDFVLRLEGRIVYGEHLGRLGEKAYRARQEKKVKTYRHHGIQNGKNLLITAEEYDEKQGISTIDLMKIVWRMVNMKLVEGKQLRKLLR